MMSEKKHTRRELKAQKKKFQYAKETSKFLQRFPLVMNMNPLHARPTHFREYFDNEIKRGFPFSSLESQRAAIQHWYKLQNRKKLLLSLPEDLKEKKSIRYLSLEDIEMLFRDFGLGLCASFLRLLYATGLGLQEALDLRKKDVDINNCRLLVRGKGHKLSRRSIFSPSLQGELILIANTCEPDDYFFSVRNHRGAGPRKPLARRTPQTFLEKVCERLGMQDVSIRTLRDNFALHLLQVKIPKEKVSRLMRFRNIHSIERYQDFVNRENLNARYPIEPHITSKYWLLENYRRKYGRERL